jgi:predicted TPR repeat methyltransferase
MNEKGPVEDGNDAGQEFIVEEELTIEQVLALGRSLANQKELTSAAAVFQQVLEVVPDHPDALNLLGLVTYHLGDHKQALELIRRAAALAPEHAGIQNNLGNLLIEARDVEGAVEAYKKSIELDPTRPEPLNNVGIILKTRGRYKEAEEILREALALDPKHVPAHYNLCNVLLRMDRPREAVDNYWKAVACMPSHKFDPHFVAIAYDRLGDRKAAIEVLQDWKNREPDNIRLKHLLASFTGESVPARASDEYVEMVFDSFANSFESRLEDLEYKAPQLVGEAFRAAVGEPRGDLRILDAGCGTGLCAPHLRPHARHLSGVDLSAGMLARAKVTELYDELTKAELTAFLACKAAEYDAVISADTLCYFGDLEEFAATAARAIKPGGTLVFTVEALADSAPEEHKITKSGRYTHSGRYLDRILPEAGFEIIARDSKVLRMENLEPVAGWLVSARRR